MSKWNMDAIRLGGGSIGIVLVSLVLAGAQLLSGSAQAPIL